MEYLADNWGSLASVTGVVVSLAGLAWAIIEARGARSASLAARAATNETRSDIARYLQAVDLQRAIALIQRIKLLHDTRRWDAALEQYQSLREMLSYIIAPLHGESSRDPGPAGQRQNRCYGDGKPRCGARRTTRCGA